MTPSLSHIFPESCLLILTGILIGLMLFHVKGVHVSPLTPTTFFLYMLPPIILDAGYFVPNRLFFDHLGTILLFAVIGTIWNVVSIGTNIYSSNFDVPELIFSKYCFISSLDISTCSVGMWTARCIQLRSADTRYFFIRITDFGRRSRRCIGSV